MFERDYLTNLIAQLIRGIMRSIDRARNQEDPLAAAELIEQTVADATQMDSEALLSLAPESFAMILQVSGTDEALVGYLVRSLLLESEYLAQAGRGQLASLREEQALALASAYGQCVPADLEDFSELEEGAFGEDD